MTIDVAFIPSTHTSFDTRRYECFKKYRFICTYFSIKKGDVITSPDYSQRMIVTEVYPKDERTVHCGISLKTINIGTVNVFKSQREDINNSTEMEKRTISISLCQAREWYKSGNAALRKLALSAYTESELQPDSYDGIMEELKRATTCKCIDVPVCDVSLVTAISKLRNIALFLNDGWQKEQCELGYFIAPNANLEYSLAGVKYGWAICKHSNVKYPGLVYFRTEEAARRAIDIAHKEGWLDDMK